MQTRVVKLRKQFEAAVARGRGITAEEVNERFGKGAVLDADEALEVGAVNKVVTFNDFIRGNF